MKFVFCLFLFSTIISCYEKQDTLNTNKSIKQEVISEKLRHPTEIFFDSFAYKFIHQIKIIDTNDILVESLSEFKEEFITFTPWKGNQKEKNIISLYDMQLGIGPVATYEKKDSLFVKKQLHDSKDRFWSIYKLQFPETLNKYYEWKEKNPDFDWGKFKANGFGCFVTLSAPIFNKSKDKVVIMIGNQCHGTLGAGYVYFFELNKSGIWEKSRDRQLWIS